MAVDRSDLRARLFGFLFFLPILLSIVAGAPYVVIGMGLAGFWVSYELASARHCHRRTPAILTTLSPSAQ